MLKIILVKLENHSWNVDEFAENVFSLMMA